MGELKLGSWQDMYKQAQILLQMADALRDIDMAGWTFPEAADLAKAYEGLRAASSKMYSAAASRGKRQGDL